MWRRLCSACARFRREHGADAEDGGEGAPVDIELATIFVARTDEGGGALHGDSWLCYVGDLYRLFASRSLLEM